MNQTATSQSNKNSNLSTYIILFLALGAMAFFGMCTPQGPNSGLTGLAGSVGDEEISNQEFVRAYERYAQQMKQQYGENYNPQALKVASTVLNQLINDRILYIKANELGLKATDHEVATYLSNQNAFIDDKGQFTEEYFRRFLRANRYSESTFQEELRRFLTVQKLRQFLTGNAFVSNKAIDLEYELSESKMNLDFIKVDLSSVKVEPTEQEILAYQEQEGAKDRIKAWYDSHQSDFKKPEKVKARHILIGYKGARSASPEANALSNEAAKAKAESILSKLKENNEDFVTVAKRETHEASGKKSGGDLGYFSRESMVKEFSDAAFALKAGELSSVVESPFGFHIIKVEDRKDAESKSLEDATPAIVKTFINQEKGPQLAEERAGEVLKALEANNEEATHAVLNKYGLKWKNTGDFALTARYIPSLGSSQEIKDAVFQLSESSPLHKNLVKSGKAYFILKLKSFKKVDPKNMDDEKRQQLAASASFTQGYAYFSSFSNGAFKEFEEKGKIYKNPAYLAIDERSPEEG